jgi:hypothetical protein
MISTLEQLAYHLVFPFFQLVPRYFDEISELFDATIYKLNYSTDPNKSIGEQILKKMSRCPSFSPIQRRFIRRGIQYFRRYFDLLKFLPIKSFVDFLQDMIRRPNDPKFDYCFLKSHIAFYLDFRSIPNIPQYLKGAVEVLSKIEFPKYSDEVFTALLLIFISTEIDALHCFSLKFFLNIIAHLIVMPTNSHNYWTPVL